MTPEQKLAAIFAQQAAPARDLVFMSVTAQRIARRRAVLSVLACLPWGLVAALMLWALQPVLQKVWIGGGELQPALGMLGLSAVALAAAFRAVRRLTPG
ncbi:hypothetical protein D3C87_261110 [compost metagenome]